MNRFIPIARIEGTFFALLGTLSIPSLILAIVLKENSCIVPLLFIVVLCIATGIITRKLSNSSQMTLKSQDGFILVVTTLLILSIIGIIPYILSGAIVNPVDALFESISGFTTTGSTVLENVEALPLSILLWRSTTQWVSGIITILIITIISFGYSGDASHPNELLICLEKNNKFVSVIPFVTKLMLVIYAACTVLESLLLAIAGLKPFDAIIHSMGTLSTGGFSSFNDNLLRFENTDVPFIVGAFMLITALSFTTYFYIAKGRGQKAIKDETFSFYMFVFALAIVLAIFSLIFQGGFGVLGSFEKAFFGVTSVLSTTGYVSSDYTLWPTFAQMIIITLFFIGANEGSLGSGLKSIRFMVGLKLVKRGITLRLHPTRIAPITLNKRELPTAKVTNIAYYIFTYFLAILIGTILLSLNGLDFVTNITASISSLSNVGPGFALVGPGLNYGIFSPLSKLIICALMIAGKVGLYTILVLFSRSYWNHNRVN